MRKIILVLLSVLLLTACGGNKAEVIDKKEVARIQEIDRLRGKALTEKVLADREEEKKLAKKDEEKKEQEKMKKEIKDKELLINDDPKPTTVIGSAKEQSHEVPTQQAPQQPSQSKPQQQAPQQPSQPKPQPTPPPKEEKPTRLGQLGNSGMEFSTQEQAIKWTENILDNFSQRENLEGKLGFEITGYSITSVYWSDDTFTFSPDFY